MVWFENCTYLRCQIHHNNSELKIRLPTVALRKTRIRLQQLDGLGILNRNHSFEEIYVQPAFRNEYEGREHRSIEIMVFYRQKKKKRS